MRSPAAPPRKIAIGYHPVAPGAADTAREVAEWLQSQGLAQPLSASIDSEDLRQKVRARQFEAFIALGGDGTMLRAGRLCAPIGLPILGINLGHFGFLTEVRREAYRECLHLMLQGKYWLEDRLMLHVEHWRGGDLLGEWEALNEVVVTRGQYVRPIKLSAYINEFLFAHYVADGLIASTPTGSTAYALAAGGPIMPPELHNILLIPLAPHLSLDRGVILAEGSRVKIVVRAGHETVFSVDGHAPVLLEENDSVLASASYNVATFLRFEDAGYIYRNLMQYMERNPTTGGYS